MQTLGSGRKKHVMLKGLNSISQGLWLTQFGEFGLISGKMLTGSKRQNLYGVHCLVKHQSAVIRGNHRNVHFLYLAVWFHVFYVIVPEFAKSKHGSTKWHRRRDQACLPVFEVKLTPNQRQGRRGHGEACDGDAVREISSASRLEDTCAFSFFDFIFDDFIILEITEN